MLFAALDILPITERSLKQKVNKVSEVCDELNQMAMASNCEKLKLLMSVTVHVGSRHCVQSL